MQIGSVQFACCFLVVFHAGTSENAALVIGFLFGGILGDGLRLGINVLENIERISFLRARNPFAILRMVGRCEDCFIR